MVPIGLPGCYAFRGVMVIMAVSALALRRFCDVGAIYLAMSMLPAPALAQSIIPGGGWSGPYIGITAGGAFANVKNATSASGLTWSGYAGYGINLSALYLGAEVDATWGGSSAKIAGPLQTSELEVDWSTSARARVGVTFGGVLLYATGGAAWSRQSLGVASLAGGAGSTSKTLSGYVVGGGVEMKLLPFVSGRIEALHYDYSSGATDLQVGLPAAAISASSRGLDETVVRAGISLRFN